MLNYRYTAYTPGVKARIVETAINSSGVRDTARVLGTSKRTVIGTLKKSVHSGTGESGLRYSH